jgi:hypothetical protein
MKRIALALLLPAALVFAGCWAYIESITVTQFGPGGPVKIVTTLCPPSVTSTDCHATKAFDDVDADGAQIGVAYLVPEGFTPTSVKVDGPNDLVLHEESTLAAANQTASPAPVGRKWVGFASGLIVGPTPDDPKRAVITAAFDPPGAAGATPVADFPYTVQVGGRDIEGACVPTSTWGAGSPCTGGGGVGPITGVASDGIIAVRDLALRADGARPSFERGGRREVPFTAIYAGAAPGGAMRYTGTTTIPGGAVVPGTIAAAPSGDRPTPVPVEAQVDVPAATPPGDYGVTLTLDLAGAAVRTVSRQVTVRAQPAPVQVQAQQPQQQPTRAAVAPRTLTIAEIRTALQRLRFVSTARSAIMANGLLFAQDIPLAGSATWTLTLTRSGRGGRVARTTRLARVTRRFARAERPAIRLRIARSARRSVRRGSRLTLTTTFVDEGNRRVVVRKPLRVQG